MEALFSPLLKLNLTPEEKEVLSIMYDVNRDKKVRQSKNVTNFCSVLKTIAVSSVVYDYLGFQQFSKNAI